MKEQLWNPWHGCHKISEGCRHCYVYRSDARYGRRPDVVERTGEFDLPVRKDRFGEWKIAPGTLVYTCFTSDFFVKEADAWRPQTWEMIRRRSDLDFLFITKRIHRFYECIPPDWGDGYKNVKICCTVENPDRAAFRLPIFTQAPIRRRGIVCEPLLGPVDLSRFLGPGIEDVMAGGESGPEARLCDYSWILDLRRQCVEAGVRFWFKQTGTRFLKDGRLYRVPRRLQHSQARKAGINYDP